MTIGRLVRIAELFGDFDISVRPDHDILWIGGPDPDDLDEDTLEELEEQEITWDPIQQGWRVFV